MSRMPLISPESVDESLTLIADAPMEKALATSVQKIYAEMKRDFGRISPLFQVLANNPLVLGGVWNQICSTLLQGTLPRTVKEMIMIAISSRNEINYCINMHSLSLRNLGCETAIIDALVRDPMTAPLPAPTRAAVLFALKASAAPLNITDEDFTKLQETGFSTSEILELIATANLATNLNTLAATIDIPIPSEL